MSLIVVTAPAAEPVTLAQAKAHCRIDHDLDDALLAIYIAQARERAEHELQRSVIAKTYELNLDAFPDGPIDLPMGPVVPAVSVLTVSSVKYSPPGGGAEVTVSSGDYTLDAYSHVPAVIPVSGWPSAAVVPNAVRVRYVSGPVSGATPAAVIEWMLLQIGSAYEHREGVGIEPNVAEMPFAGRLLDPFRSYL